HAFVRADARRAAELPAEVRANGEEPEATFEAADGETADGAGAGATAAVLHVDLLVAWIQLEAVLDLVAAGDAALEEARSRPPAYLSTVSAASAIEPARALVEHAPGSATTDAGPVEPEAPEPGATEPAEEPSPAAANEPG